MIAITSTKSHKTYKIIETQKWTHIQSNSQFEYIHKEMLWEWKQSVNLMYLTSHSFKQYFNIRGFVIRKIHCPYWQDSPFFPQEIRGFY
jgi:uncharacterized protein YydD (DUF2326 family)